MLYARWDQQLSEEDNRDILEEIALRFFKRAGEAGHVPAYHLVSRDYASLVRFKLDYERVSADQARYLRQGLSLFQKRGDIDLGIDRRQVAVDKFMEAERRCRDTNECFKLRAVGKFQFFPRTERVLWHASRKISSILGPVPSISALKLKFGPGATTSLPKRKASARAKLGHPPACSTELFPARSSLLAEMPAWASALADAGPIPPVIHEGRIAFVPKSAKEDRTIMVEPSLNTMVQAGIGSYMAERLRRAGVDIRDQSPNQRAARKGSLDGSLATVDLSSASDTVATELVYDLLGIDWACFLARARTSKARLGGTLLNLEKFSSMGNGFTFPLETVIFYSIAFGVCVEAGLPTRDVRAYGDDIIIPSEAFGTLCSVLEELGFLVNRDKSYSSGPFRESCGADYHQGIDIRPVYIKDRMQVRDLFRLHNHFYRWFESEICEYILSFLDPSVRIFGPDGYGDGHLLGTWVPVKKKSHLARGFAGAIFDTFVDKPVRSFRSYPGDRVLPSYSVYLREESTLDEFSADGTPHDPFVGQKPTLRVMGSESQIQFGVGDTFSVPLPGKLGIRRISVYTIV